MNKGHCEVCGRKGEFSDNICLSCDIWFYEMFTGKRDPRRDKLEFLQKRKRELLREAAQYIGERFIEIALAKIDRGEFEAEGICRGVAQKEVAYL